MNTKTSILMAKARRPLGCGVRKFGILLTVMVAAIIALPNTVTNDVVVATSDAELRISDRGLGLGLEVVGGGAAEVKLETRPGWRFRDGSTSVTLNKAAGEPAKSPAIEGEGNGAENYVPGVDVNDDESGGDENDKGSVDHEKPVLSLTASAPKVVAYSVLDGGTNVSISLSATVTTKGKHRKLDANGNVVKEEEFSPKRYVWKMTGAATGEAETDSASHTFTVNLTKGEDQRLNFSVVGKICSICDGDVESDEVTDSVEIDVYELSISRGPYLGLNRTDAGRQSHVVKTATLSSDPSLPSSSSVEWKECGICEFVGAKNQLTVSYQNKDSETASGEYLAERLAASVTLAGMDSSVVCATNFTVVKVDVTIVDVGEYNEESEGLFVQFIPDASGVISEDGKNAMKKASVAFSCQPELPPGEEVEVSCTGPGELYEKLPDGELSIAKNTYPACDIGNHTFMLHGHVGSGQLCDGLIRIVHTDSGAKDEACLTVLGLKTETFATTPADRTRKTIGVGEKLTATLLPASLQSVVWSVNGGGSISAQTGNQIDFTATNRAATATITAECKGFKFTALLSIIEPDGVTMTKICDNPIPHGVIGAEMKASIQLLPTTVSFYNVQCLEMSGPASEVHGYFTQFSDSELYHKASSIWVEFGQDNFASGGDLLSFKTTRRPWSEGRFVWHIPWRFRVGPSDGGKTFKVVDQWFWITDNGLFMIQKAGAWIVRVL